MSKQQPTSKKPLVNLPFPMPNTAQDNDQAVHNSVRPNLSNMRIRLGHRHVVLVVRWVSAKKMPQLRGIFY